MNGPDRYPEWLEWILAFVFVAGFIFLGIPMLAVVMPVVAIVGFLAWALGTPRRHR